MHESYHQMQDSAEVWLGEVPLKWKSFRIKDISQLSPGFSKDSPESVERCTVVPMEKLSDKGEVFTDTIAEYNLVTSGLTIFESGDVLFAKITPCMENGKGAYVKKLPTRYAFGSTEFHVLRPGYLIDGKFLYYYLYNKVYRDYAEANMTGAAGQKRVSARFLKYTRIFLPKIDQQKIIVSYLERTCNSIDKAIESKKKQLETLDALRKSIIHKAVTKGLDDSVELKDSGVEWFEKTPATWNVYRIKDVAKFSPNFSGGNPTLSDICTVIPMDAVSEHGEITNEQLQEFNLISGGLTNFEVGDVIFAKITPCMENGKGAFISSLPTKYAFGSTEFHVIRPSIIVNGKFLYYYTYNHVFRRYAEKNMTGAAGQKRVSTNFLKYTKIFLPGLDTQRRIVSYLDKKCYDISMLWKNITDQITILEQYRKSLIHECVTGKRRIKKDEIKKINSEGEL